MKNFNLKSKFFTASIMAAVVFFGCSNETIINPPGTGTDVPNSPVPADGAVDQLPTLSLSWQATNAATYDVFLDTKNPPQNLFASSLDTNTVTVSGLNYQQTYFWKVIAKSSSGSLTNGPVWSFTTASRTGAGSGFLFIKHSFETRPPNIVSALFQVVDLNGFGITDLDSSKFQVFEDGQPVSASESQVQIKKRSEIPNILQTVLMLDNSTSLSNKLDTIKTEASKLIDNLAANQEVAIYTFSDHATLIQDFSSNVVQLKSAINSIRLGFPTTNLYGAVITGASKVVETVSFNSITQGVLIIFTDGHDTQGSYSFGEAITAIQGKTVYTVGLGDEIDPDVLNKLGTSGFFSISQASQLSAKLLEIQKEIVDFANSFYILDYQSPKRGDFNHTLKISLKNNVFSGQGSSAVYEFNSRAFYSVKPGLYVNSSKNQPNGISSVALTSGAVTSLQAYSLLVANSPSFSWQTNNAAIVSVQADQNDESKATIKAEGSSGQSAVITVIDAANNLSKQITVNIQ